MSSPNEPNSSAYRARSKRKQNRRVRQTVIFGSICGAMLLALLLSSSIYSGTIDGPFDIAFTSDKEDAQAPTPPPCPDPEDTPITYSDVELNIYNTTDVSGLAAAASDAFHERGFEVLEVSNEDIPIKSTAELRFGPHAIAAAYTVEAQLDGALLRLDENRTDTVVDVLLGESYDELRPTEVIELVPDEPLDPLPDCVPVTVPDEDPEDPADEDGGSEDGSDDDADAEPDDDSSEASE